MTECLGLIPCTPPPTAAPLGLTLAEVQAVSDLTAVALFLGFVAVVSIIAILATMALVIATRE